MVYRPARLFQENFGRQEQNLEQHYSDVLQTLSQRNSENSTSLQNQKKQKLEALYGQLLACGRLLDASKELIENAQELHRCQNKRAFLQVRVQKGPAQDLKMVRVRYTNQPGQVWGLKSLALALELQG